MKDLLAAALRRNAALGIQLDNNSTDTLRGEFTCIVCGEARPDSDRLVPSQNVCVWCSQEQEAGK